MTIGRESAPSDGFEYDGPTINLSIGDDDFVLTWENTSLNTVSMTTLLTNCLMEDM